MAIITWRDDMTTGFPDLDAQHKDLFARINGLHDAMLKGKAREELSATLAALIDYTAVHFAKEERCMAEKGCPIAKINIEQHRAFVAQMKVFQGRLAVEGPSVGLVVALKNELATWLTTHVCRTDTQLAPFAKR